MSETLGRADMLAMLHELDDALGKPAEVVICGGSAAILTMGLDRRSMDVDVIESSVALTAPRFQEAIMKVAVKHGRGPQWLSDKASAVRGRLPASYRSEAEPVPGETFHTLLPRVVTKAEFVVTKLVIHEHIRPRDIRDIADVAFAKADFEALWSRLWVIAGADQGLALAIEAHFKSIRPEFALDQYGNGFIGASDITGYLSARYGLTVGVDEQNEWREAIDGNLRTAASIVARKELEMARLVGSPDTQVAVADMTFRRREAAL